MEKENELTWLRVDRNTQARTLYDFINYYLTFNEVVELYRLLKFKMEYNIDMENKNMCLEGYEE
jgi:hypothetical protein